MGGGRDVVSCLYEIAFLSLGPSFQGFQKTLRPAHRLVLDAMGLIAALITSTLDSKIMPSITK